MASDFSFDIVSEVDLQAIDDAVNVSMKEIANRFDLKGTDSTIIFNRGEKLVILSAGSDFYIKQIKAILAGKLAKRGISQKSLSLKKIETNVSGAVRETHSIICGIEKELAKSIVKDIKTLNLKIQASIQDEQIRVSGKAKDDLQSVISFIKSKDYPIPLQFVNYR